MLCPNAAAHCPLPLLELLAQEARVSCDELVSASIETDAVYRGVHMDATLDNTANSVFLFSRVVKVTMEKKVQCFPG